MKSARLDDAQGRSFMWPRSEERGNVGGNADRKVREFSLQCGRAPRSAEMTSYQPPVLTMPVGLQCGRAPRSAEIRRNQNLPVMQQIASMWPRSEERGNSECSAAQIGTRRASMWPRSEERGNFAAGIWYPRKQQLQCGRAPRSAEIAPV